MKIVFFGTPEFAVVPLHKLMESGHDIIAVVTQPDRQSGRGKHLKACPVKVAAEDAGLKLIQPGKVRDPAFINELRVLKPSGIVVAAYGQILPSEIIHLPEYGCVNIHASLLPKYRGAAPINWAIIKGEEKTGVTTMLMDEGMDTGPVLLQDETTISAEDTAETLSARLSVMGADLLVPTLKGLEAGSLRPVPQSGEVTYAPLLKKSDGFVDWGKSSKEVCDFIRGMNPWPGAYGFIGGERYKIVRAVPACQGTTTDADMESGSSREGMICEAGKDKLIVHTGKGGISIIEIQPSGKPVMDIKSFLQGRKLSKGMRFDLKGD